MPVCEGLGSGGEKTAVVIDLGEAFTKRDGNCKRLCQGKQEDVWLNIAVAGRPTLPIPSPQQDVCLHISMAGKPTLPPQQVFVKDICLHIAHQLTPWCRTFALWNHGVGREDPLVTVLDVCTTAGWRMWLQLYKRTAPTSIERKNISPTGLATNRTVGTLQLQGGVVLQEKQDQDALFLVK